ncbi:protein translocase subunit SecF [bacterium]|nr:protein translocase subunit SecF [bacterium]
MAAKSPKKSSAKKPSTKQVKPQDAASVVVANAAAEKPVKGSHEANIASPSGYSVGFMAFHKAGLVISALLILATIVGWIMKGPTYGVDFTGGMVLELRTETALDITQLRKALEETQKGGATIQQFGSDKDVMVRLQAFEGENQKDRLESVKAIIASVAGPVQVEYRKVDYVGPQVGSELVRGGVIATILSFAAIMAYVWFRFEWQYGVGALLALMHDAILTIGLYLVLPVEFNLSSIAAVLTVLGYSINDSVVIFDRIRENMRKFKRMPLADLIDRSLNDTLSRTILTGTTVGISLSALVLLGGAVIRDFCGVILLGVVIGTYSSMFISAPVLIYFGLKRDAETASERPEQAGAAAAAR